MRASSDGERGFSLIELLVATLLFAVVAILAVSVTAHGFRVSRARPDAGDLHQRLRVATEMIRNDLLAAGAGLLHGDGAGPLVQFFAPIVPARTGAVAPDPALSAFADRISIFYAPEGAWLARPAADILDPSSIVSIDPSVPGCPPAGLCGFSEGSRVVLMDRTALGEGHEVFTVTGISAGLAHGAPNPMFSRPYAAASTLLLPIVQRVYYLDRVQRRLMLYDGYVSDLPLVDHVTELTFAYFGSPSPIDVPRPTAGAANCLFSGSASNPALTDLGGVSPRLLGLADLQDGPVCGTGPGRFDGDLVRLRIVRVTLRLDVAADDLRAGGPDFRRPGTATRADGDVSDYEVTFDVSLQNLAPVR
jgi:prepilin-type N-terminal cleavage/methylation domain-containing protein